MALVLKKVGMALLCQGIENRIENPKHQQRIELELFKVASIFRKLGQQTEQSLLML
jgi:hypothetical protein